MWFFGSSPARQAREQAAQLLLMADKVDAYRCDVVPPKDLAAMRAAAAILRKLHEDKKTPTEVLNRASEVLHETMLPCGGDIYPVTFLGDNVEMVVACAILFIGIRTFFLSPFQIPTNSMYPTYSGMTPYVYPLSEPSPGPLQKVWSLVTHGSSHYEITSPFAGEVMLPVRVDLDGSIIIPWQEVKERNWSRLFIIPVDRYQYTVFVGSSAFPVSVPADFNRGFDEIFFGSYFPELYQQAAGDPARLGRLLREGGYLQTDAAGVTFVRTGKIVQAGGRVVSFDVRAGDMLFVDRFSYNFIAPKPGDPFVFHTRDLPIQEWMRGRAIPNDQYYIKRLVGVPGDQLEIRPPALYRNGEPITGARAFEFEATQQDKYPGYCFRGRVGPGNVVTVQPGEYFAMGDNSPESLDSRYWGGVPGPNVVGRALFIIYPFTHRWGPAR